MLTPLQREKQTHYFRLVDIDKDGFITASDWAEIGRNLASIRGLKSHTPEYDGVMAIIGTIWAHLGPYASDPNRGRVSLEDWLRFEDERVVHCDDAWYDSYVNTIVRGVFDLLDSEDRGWIGLEQYIDLGMSFWMQPQAAMIAFEKLDVDGDGRIFLDEFIQHVLDFHRSDHPETPGNWLFGPWQRR